jgi:hypothetical protein
LRCLLLDWLAAQVLPIQFQQIECAKGCAGERTRAIAAGEYPEAIMLDFVNPTWAGRGPC